MTCYPFVFEKIKTHEDDLLSARYKKKKNKKQIYGSRLPWAQMKTQKRQLK